MDDAPCLKVCLGSAAQHLNKEIQLPKLAYVHETIKFILVYFCAMYLENTMFPLVSLLYLLYLLPESL